MAFSSLTGRKTTLAVATREPIHIEIIMINQHKYSEAQISGTFSTITSWFVLALYAYPRSIVVGVGYILSRHSKATYGEAGCHHVLLKVSSRRGGCNGMFPQPPPFEALLVGDGRARDSTLGSYVLELMHVS